MIGSVLLAVLLAGIAAAFIRLTRRTDGGGMEGTVRRLVTAALIGGLVVLGASGLTGVLGRVLDTTPTLAGADTAGMARALTFTILGVPAAGLTWWSWWRRIDSGERRAAVWGGYLWIMATISLIVALIGLGRTASSLVTGDPLTRPAALGVVWLAVWAWHRWMAHHRDRSPTKLVAARSVSGAVVGLLLATGAGVVLVGTLIGRSMDALTNTAVVGARWWEVPASAALWASLGMLTWWEHWHRDDARRTPGVAADVASVASVGLGSALALAGAIAVLYTTLDVVFSDGSLRPGLEPAEPGGAGLLVGALLWSYHRAESNRRGRTTPAQLVVAGLALAAAATGFGTVTNALLSTFGTRISGDDGRSLLFAGVASLVVGATVWWGSWKQHRHTAGGDDGARRTYLIIVFGVSAVAALGAAFTIGFRTFEAILDPDVGSSIDRFRAGLGTLLAAGLTAGYHFPIWRAAAGQDRDDTGQRLREVIVIGPPLDGETRRDLRAGTGASVSVWERRDAAEPTSANALLTALAGTSGERVVLVVDGDGDVQRIEIAPAG